MTQTPSRLESFTIILSRFWHWLSTSPRSRLLETENLWLKEQLALEREMHKVAVAEWEVERRGLLDRLFIKEGLPAQHDTVKVEPAQAQEPYLPARQRLKAAAMAKELELYNKMKARDNGNQ